VANELYANVFGKTFGLSVVGLRYFNVFGPRQSPEGPYAAVIPKWTSAMLSHETIQIFGDGEASRDFCYVDNAVQGNILAALSDEPKANNQVFNIAVGDQTTLNELIGHLRASFEANDLRSDPFRSEYLAPRAGDVLHSLADIGKAQGLLGYKPEVEIAQGLVDTVAWFVGQGRESGK